MGDQGNMTPTQSQGKREASTMLDCALFFGLHLPGPRNTFKHFD